MDSLIRLNAALLLVSTFTIGGCADAKDDAEVGDTTPVAETTSTEPTTDNPETGTDDDASSSSTGSVEPASCECGPDEPCNEPLCPVVVFHDVCHDPGFGTTGDDDSTGSGSGGAEEPTSSGDDTGALQCADIDAMNESIDCALQALAAGEPGRIDYHWIESHGVNEGEGTLYLLGDGRLVQVDTRREDLCHDISPTARLGEAKSPDVFEDCRSGDAGDKIQCLSWPFESVESTCSVADFTCDD